MRHVEGRWQQRQAGTLRWRLWEQEWPNKLLGRRVLLKLAQERV